jgi:O-antigen/teichoic acid export membrane protein
MNKKGSLVKNTIKQFKENILVLNSSIYFSSNILNAAIPFLLLPILTRYLLPSEYGEIAMFQLLLAILVSMMGFGAIGASVRSFYEDKNNKEEGREYIGSCLIVLMMSGLLFVSIILVSEKKLVALLNLDKVWILLTLVIAFLTFIVQLRLTQYQIRGKAAIYGVIQVGQTLLTMGISLVLIIKFLEGPEGRLYGQLFTALIFSGVSLYYLYKDNIFLINLNFKQIIKVLKFGIPTIPHELGIIILAFADRFYINQKLGLSEAGIYMVAIQIAAIMGVATSSINNAYVPWLFERLKRNIYSEKLQIVKFTYIYFFITIILAILSFYMAPAIIKIIAGNNYSSAAEVVGWLFLSQAFTGMYLMVTNYIFYTGKTIILGINSTISCFAYITLLNFFIVQYGIKGAAIASALIMLLRFLTVWFFANRCFQMPWLFFMKKYRYEA